jgi:hypothetical protein
LHGAPPIDWWERGYRDAQDALSACRPANLSDRHWVDSATYRRI